MLISVAVWELPGLIPMLMDELEAGGLGLIV